MQSSAASRAAFHHLRYVSFRSGVFTNAQSSTRGKLESVNYNLREESAISHLTIVLCSQLWLKRDEQPL